MSLNLIDQSDILKGLDDTTLQREMSAPSGGVPPFLVLSEISRRKDMRQRYAGELATRAPTTTVAEDVMSAPSMPGAGPSAGGMPGGMPGGIAAAAQMGGGMPDAPIPPAMQAPGPGYASGGIVDAVDPNADWQGLVQKYQSNLNDLPAERNRDAALALIQAGAGIMGAGHSNTLQNIGVGVNAGVNAYGEALKATDGRETDALRGLSSLAADQHADALNRIREADSQIPNSQREFEYRQSLPPDQQATYDDVTNPTLSMKKDALVAQADQVAAIGDSKVNGTAPPTLTGLYHLAPLVQAYIAKTYPDFNLAQAQQTYDATKRMMSTLNGPGQVRLKQAIDFTDESIDKLADLADEWSGGQFPVLNKANLELAKQGAKGPEAQSLAARLEAQRNEVISELATVYKGGNSPTDEGLKLAASQFDDAWSKGTFADAVKQAKQNIQYRKNSLAQLVGGVSANNPYAPDTSGAPVTAGDAGAPPPAVGTTTDVPWSVVP